MLCLNEVGENQQSAAQTEHVIYRGIKSQSDTQDKLFFYPSVLVHQFGITISTRLLLRNVSSPILNSAFKTSFVFFQHMNHYEVEPVEITGFCSTTEIKLAAK